MSGELINRALLRDNVESTAERLRRSPGEGRVRPWVSTRLEQDVRAVARFLQYDQPHEMRCDESRGRAGLGLAPSPMRYLLGALAFCLQGWCAKVVSVREIDVEDLQIDARTLLDMRGEHLVDGVPAHPQWFVLDVRISSASSPQQVIDMVSEAVRRCPVTALVARAVPVHLLITHNGTMTYDERPDDLRREHEEITTA
jgi:uncharacterized OsmC-like protein